MARFACSLGISARRACWLCSTTRSALHYRSKLLRRDRHAVRALRIIARHDPAWGYRLAHGLLRLRSWNINQKRVYRLWRRAGLTLPAYRPSRKIKTGERLDYKAQTRNDVWAWDFVHDSYAVGQQFRCLTVKDEATAFCLNIEVGTSIRNGDVGAVLKKLIVRYGRPKAIRSDNGPELVATELRKCLANENIDHLRIVPGKPWQNGSNESFNGTFRKECLNAELFGSLMEAQVVIEQWRQRYNQNRPHSNQGYITPEMAYYGHRQL